MDIELETLVDRHGLTKVVAALAGICDNKAEHSRLNSQDRTTAKAWEADVVTLYRAAILICSEAKGTRLKASFLAWCDKLHRFPDPDEFSAHMRRFCCLRRWSLVLCPIF